MATQDVDAAATTATQLIWAANWHDTGEPFLWIDTVGELPGLMEHPLRASVLAGQSWAAWERGDMQRALFAALEAERPGVPTIDFYAEFAILSAAFFLQNAELADEYFARMVARARRGRRRRRC